ncbi:unnamed protein product [Brassica napus]|uniref:(rape) hypothetical protein n=1 Tax=Brassica napus TaxID=3708 RepID=A0A816UYF9_BRANA|nr:unnamed protein product [Brassica napus]
MFGQCVDHSFINFFVEAKTKKLNEAARRMEWNLPDYFLKRDQNNVLMTKKDVEPDGIKMLLLPPYKPFPSIFSKACNIRYFDHQNPYF